MDITLVVLAAGLGTRYGSGIKQLEHVGPSGEIIMDYSIHDAIQAGFNKIVFVLRREIYEDFREVIGDRLEAKLRALGVKWAYVFQELGDAPAGRTKPWGTGQAVMCCKPVLDGPFAVLNADDYYGKRAFAEAYDYLSGTCAREPHCYGMIAFHLMNTLSDVGGVTRGVCAIDENGYLTDIAETRHIVRIGDGAAVREENGLRPLDKNSLVSMNLWLFSPDFLDGIEEDFAQFRAGMKDPMTDEFLLPELVGKRVMAGKATVKAIQTGDQWFGITYHEDRAPVTKAFHGLVEQGLYPPDLYSDI